MATKGSSGRTPATAALVAAGVSFTLHPYAATDRARDGAEAGYADEAAAAMGVPAGTVFKTLMVDADDGLWVAVVPANRRLDLKAMAGAVGGKRAAMADPASAERSSGYVLGGISPVGQRRARPTLVDSCALDLPWMYVSGGRRGLDIGLAPADLIRVTGARTAPISAARKR